MLVFVPGLVCLCSAMVVVCVRSTGGADGFHNDIQDDVFRLFKLKHDWELIPLFEGLFKTDQHDVIAARNKRHGFMRRQVDGVDTAHLHHAVF